MRGLSFAEQEVLISKCADEDAWCCTASDPVYVRQLRRIASTMGLSVRDLDRYTIRVYLPKRCVRVSVPRVMSEKQLAHSRAMLAALHQQNRNQAIS